jgi:hypothetical protein
MPVIGTLIPLEVINALLELKPSPLHHMYRLTPAAKVALANHLAGLVVESGDYGEKLTFVKDGEEESVYLMIDYDAMIADGEEWDDPIDADLANEFTVIDNDEFGGDENVQTEVLQALTLAAQDVENPNDDVEMNGGKKRRRKGKGKTLKGKGKRKTKTTRRRKPTH